MVRYEQIAIRIQNLIKQIIKGKGLVKTGHLLDSIKISFSSGKDGVKFALDALDYFWILDAKYGIIDTMVQTAEYNQIEQDILELNGEEFMKQADKEIDEIIK